MGRSSGKLKLMRRHLNNRYVGFAVFKSIKNWKTVVAYQPDAFSGLLQYLVKKGGDYCFAFCSRDTDAEAVGEVKKEIRLTSNDDIPAT